MSLTYPVNTSCGVLTLDLEGDFGWRIRSLLVQVRISGGTACKLTTNRMSRPIFLNKNCFQEASLADITYLFESGALIDFESEELVQLLEGLFSDTALRAKTIQKIRTEIPGGTQL